METRGGGEGGHGRRGSQNLATPSKGEGVTASGQRTTDITDQVLPDKTEEAGDGIFFFLGAWRG